MTSVGDSPAGYDLDALQAHLRTRALGRNLRYVETAESTNVTAMALAEKGIADGAVVLAETQTAGRGRRGRPWHSLRGQHLYCSIIVRMGPEFSSCLSWIPHASALASADAVFETTRLPVALKWPNDLVVSDKKLGGILCEKAGGEAQGFVVIGVGLNVNCDPSDFPDDLGETATSLKIEQGQSVKRTDVLVALLNRLELELDRLRTKGPAETHAAYVRRSATLGRQVRVMLTEADPIEGLAESIGPDGCLRVRRPPDVSLNRKPSLIEVRSTDVIHLRTLTSTS